MHPLPACSSDPEHVSSLYQTCAAVAQQQFWWRPRCWGCSNYDYFAADSAYGALLREFMWGVAAMLFVVIFVGFVGTWLLLQRHVPQQLQQMPVASMNSSAPSSSGATLPTAAGLLASAGPTGVDAAVSTGSHTTTAAAAAAMHSIVAGAQSSSGPAAANSWTHWSGLACSLAPAVATSSRPQHKDIEQQWQQQQQAAGLAACWLLTYPAIKHSSADHLLSSTHTIAQNNSSLLCSVKHPILPSNLTPWSSVAADGEEQGNSLALEILALVVVLVVADLVVFNCHWYIQAALLPVGFMYLLWLHLGHIRLCATKGPLVACSMQTGQHIGPVASQHVLTQLVSPCGCWQQL